MKKIILTLIVITLSSHLHAQWLGTNPVYFTSGNVGIGTNSPNGLLDVRGNIKLGDVKDSYLGVNAINNYIPYTSTYHSILNSGNSLYFNIDANNNDTNRAFIFASNRNGESAGTELMRISESGNVGIGTTSPNGLLDIKRPSSSSAEIVRFTDGAYKLGSIQSLSSSDGIGLVVTGRSEGGSAPAPALTFAGYANDVSPDNDYDAAVSVRGFNVADGSKLTNMPVFRVMNSHTDVHLSVEADGNVGIGTTSPTSKFHIKKGDSNGSFDAYTTTAIEDADARLQLLSSNAGSNGSALILTNENKHWSFHQKTSVQNNRLDIGYLLANSGNIPGNHSISMSFSTNGNVGIGTTTPDQSLVVNGRIAFDYGNNNSYSGLYRNGIKTEYYNGITGVASNVIHEFTGSNSTIMSLTEGGHVGIGTTSPGNKLEVNGTIRSKKVKVDANGWPDYVFAASYDLRALSEVENYIKENQHLPDVPSAKDVETNGLDLGDMDATLLKKVEELTLYTINQQKKIDQQAKENLELKDRMSKIEALLKTLTSK